MNTQTLPSFIRLTGLSIFIFFASGCDVAENKHSFDLMLFRDFAGKIVQVELDDEMVFSGALAPPGEGYWTPSAIIPLEKTEGTYRVHVQLEPLGGVGPVEEEEISFMLNDRMYVSVWYTYATIDSLEKKLAIHASDRPPGSR